ncbi:hypothetical protein Q1695_010100 [Nippostrongylus brasiliensis]|nr:hypothetical protein Q1695_010100 [Nippostrongylus brasiliensis]
MLAQPIFSSAALLNKTNWTFSPNANPGSVLRSRFVTAKMKGILTLALMSAVAHLSHGVGSVAIDIKNCTRTNPMYVGLASEKNLTQDLQNLGYHFTPSSTLMAYSVFDKNHIVQMFTDKQTYFFVYGDSDGDYICAQNITFERFNELITGCEQPFVLNVDLDSCLILSKNDSTVGTITKESIKRRLVGTTYDDNTKVTEVLLDSNQKSFQLYSVKSTPPKHFGTDPHRTNPKPRLISQSEYNAYMEICKDRTTA